jgi:hypothetical protein
METTKASPTTCEVSSGPGCSGFDFPHEIKRNQFADVMALMPPHKDIPREFNTDQNEWTRWQRKWFYEGLDGTPEPKAGIDADKAMRHLATIQRSWSPKHEHKEAAVAFLASLWFRSPNAAGQGRREATYPEPACSQGGCQ